MTVTESPPQAGPDRPPVASAARVGLRAVLRRPAFALLVVGQTVSQLGDKLHHVALLSLVASQAEASSSGFALGQLSIVFTLPLMFAPIAGALVDRWNKRATLIFADLFRAIIVALIPWLYRQTNHLWPVYVVAFFVFLLGVFFNAAKMSLIPDLVRREELLPANAALTSIGRVATAVGFVGGAAIIGWNWWQRHLGWQGFEAGFYMDAVSYVVSVITLVTIAVLGVRHARRHAAAHRSAHETAEVIGRELADRAAGFRETLRLVRRQRELRFVFGTVLLLGLIAASIYVAITASVQTVLGAGTSGAVYLGALAATGMIPGSLLVGSIGSHWNRQHIILVGCLLLGLLMVVGGAAFTYVAFIPIALVGGAILAPVMVSQDTLLHEWAPANRRAFIFSTRDLMLGAAFMASALLVGGGTTVLGWLGVEQPFRLALFLLGGLITAISLVAEVFVLRQSSTRRRPSGESVQ